MIISRSRHQTCLRQPSPVFDSDERLTMRFRSIVQRTCGVASLVVCVLATPEAAHAGPVRPLYLSTGSEIAVIQGISVVDSWATGDQEYSIAVNTTVRTWS